MWVLKLLAPLSKNCTQLFNFSLDNISRFPDSAFASALQADLNNNDDSKRSLKTISAVNANLVFGALGLDDPQCDANKDGSIAGD